jgi:hypothetical protein
MIDDHSMFPVPGDRVTWEKDGTFTGYVEKVIGNTLLVSSAREGGVRFRFVDIDHVVRVDKRAVVPELKPADATRTFKEASQRLWEVLAAVDHGSWRQDQEWIRQAFAARDYWLSCFPNTIVYYPNESWEEQSKRARDGYNQNCCVSFGAPGQCIRYPRGGVRREGDK